MYPKQGQYVKDFPKHAALYFIGTQALINSPSKKAYIWQTGYILDIILPNSL
jgi:hypothetical protein